MNTTLKLSAFAAAATVFAAVSAPAQACRDKNCWIEINSIAFTGAADHNWFNPANWSGGYVPGAEDSVELDGDDHVVIDQALNRSGGIVQFQDLHVRDAATFEAIGGVVVQTRDQVVEDSGRVIFRGSADIGESLVVGGASGSTEVGLPSVSEVMVTKFIGNPLSQTKRTIVLKSSFNGVAWMDMGLGGTTPASADVPSDGVPDVIVAAGPGHYATVNTDTLVIDGELRVSTYYGFTPLPGQSFQIITVNGTRSGEFIGIPEGGYVGCTEEGVGVRLSYRGGDGNDIVLSAEATDPATCLLIGLLLPAIQQAGDPTAQTREHILLARQVGVAVEETDSAIQARVDRLPSN